jgi:Endonuclease/Exonuclease/phosphatase family
LIPRRAHHLTLKNEVLFFNCHDNSNKFLKVVSINAQSIANHDHINILRHLLSNQSVDIVAISESWLKSKNSDKFCNMPGYKLIRNDREGKGGGGVAIFVKIPIKFKVLATSPSLFNPKQVEFIFCEITQGDTQILIAALYRRPFDDCSFDTFLNKMQNYRLKYDSIIMLGDFNVNFTDNANKTHKILSKFEDLDLNRLPINNTYNSKSTIDAIFTTPQIFLNCFGKLPNLLSSHDILYAVFNVPPSDESGDECIRIREFDSVPREELLDRALKIDWQKSCAVENLDKQVTLFSTTLINFYNENLPLKELKPKRSFKPRLPDSIKIAIKSRDSLRKLATRVNLFSNFSELYRAAKNRVKQMISTFYRGVIYDKLNNLIGKDLIWNTLRNLGLVKSKTNTQALPENLDELAQGLTMCPDIDQSKIKFDYNFELTAPNDQFYFSHVEPVDVKNAIFDIDTSAEGTDGICIRMIKLIWQVLVIPITNIIDNSLQLCIFPTSWKSAFMCPIPKIQNPVSFKDFRNISLLCTFSKILEKMANIIKL